MNEKMNLTESDRTILQAFVAQRGAGVDLIKKIIEFHLSDLIDIRNVDAKGNVGLQTCSRQLAYGKLEKIFSIIYSDEAHVSKEKKVNNQWQ